LMGAFGPFYPKCSVLHGFRFLTFVALRIKPSSFGLPFALILKEALLFALFFSNGTPS
jgi:hypothetical protein